MTSNPPADRLGGLFVLEEEIMKNLILKLLTAFAILFSFGASPAMAQATRTWISGVGDDANPCSRTAPCKTFAGAISKTATGGEINVLDPGGFGGVTITKSITLRADGDNGGVLVSGTNAIVINAATNSRVVIDGLDIEGLDSGLSGVNIIQARDVVVRNTAIRNFATAGILVNSSTNAAVVVDDCFLFNNGFGVRVQSSAGGGSARIYNSNIVSSNTAGVSVTGAINKAELSNNEIIRTPKPIEILSGATVSSYGDNVVSAGGDAPTLIPKT